MRIAHTIRVSKIVVERPRTSPSRAVGLSHVNGAGDVRLSHSLGRAAQCERHFRTSSDGKLKRPRLVFHVRDLQLLKMRT